MASTGFDALDLAATSIERTLAAKSAWDSPFEIEPAPIDDWIRDPYFINLGFDPSELQMAALRHFEWIYMPQTWVDLGWTRPDVELVNFLVLKWGKGSGKDTISQVGLLRIVYLLLCLRNPQAYFGIGLHSPIHLTNIAVSTTQANNVFYLPLKELLLASPFFRQYIGGPTRKPGQVKTIFDKNIELISGHSDASSQEGMNLLVGVADEIAEFRTKEEIEKTTGGGGEGTREAKMSAEGIDNMIRSSGRSRFPDVHKACYLSWTRFRGDYIERLYNEGEKAQEVGRLRLTGDVMERAVADGTLAGVLEDHRRSRWWISHAATWVANPSKKPSDFADEYAKDEANAKGKYECVPPRSVDRFFRNEVALDAAFPVRQNQPVGFEYVEGPDPDNPDHYGWQAAFSFRDDFKPHIGATYAVHIDLAHTGDKAGFAMSHVSGYEHRNREHDDDSVIPQERVELDVALAFPQGEHGEIELRWTRQLVFRLVERGFDIRRVTFDGYQSVDSIQIINAKLGSRSPSAAAEERKVADRYSLDRSTEGYDTLKSLVYNQLYDGYRTPTLHEGTAHETECVWWAEIQALQKIGGASGHAKIDHPPYGSKDVSDAIAGSAVGAIHLSRLYGGPPSDEAAFDTWVGGTEANDGFGFAEGVYSDDLTGLPTGF